MNIKNVLYQSFFIRNYEKTVDFFERCDMLLVMKTNKTKKVIFSERTKKLFYYDSKVILKAEERNENLEARLDKRCLSEDDMDRIWASA